MQAFWIKMETGLHILDNMDESLYSRRSNLVIGFHGCDQSVVEAVIAGKTELLASTNDYDWLGNGIYFWEGQELYPNAGFREKNHIQICVCNPNCIKGYFLPRGINQDYPNP